MSPPHASARVLAGVLAAALAAGACTSPSPGPVTAPTTAPGTTRATPSAGAVSTEVPAAGDLEAALDEVRAGDAPLTGVVVLQRGDVVGEAYAPGSGVDVAQPVWSVTKSVVATLVGMAVGDGLVELSTPVVDVLGAAAAEHDDVTVEHLLTMTSGIDLPDGEASVAALYGSGDWVGEVLDRPAATPPGQAFAYCSGCVHLLTAALDEVTGGLAPWAAQRLFAPLEMPDVTWERASDGSDVPIGGWGLQMTARQMAQLGQLYLDGGRHDGQQLLPAGWVAAATTPHAPSVAAFEPWQEGYGYLWWVADVPGAYAATGRGGQIVLVWPERQLVMAATADLPDARAAEAATFVWDRIAGR